MSSPKRVAALLRVSTESVAQSESPEAQHLYIREEIRRHGNDSDLWIDTGLAYEDELTGAVVLNRTGVKRLLEDARAGRFDAIAMKSIQRLGRDTLGVLHLKRMLDDLGIELIAIQDGYSSKRDPELIFLVHADRAQAGREDISKNVKNAMRQRAKQGRWMSGNVPFGYRRKNRHELEEHPDTAPILRELFRLRRHGCGYTRIVAWLNESQIPASAWWEAVGRLPKLEALAATDERYKEKTEECRRLIERRPKWTTRTLRLILANKAYYGEAEYYRTEGKVKLGGQKVRAARPTEEHITVPCPALISFEEWSDVQDVGRISARVKRRDREGFVYLLTGMLYCGKCGQRMNGGGGHPSHSKLGWYAYYHCQGRRDERTCDMKSPRVEALEAKVLEALPAALARYPEQSPEHQASIKDAQTLVVQIEAQLNDLADERRYYRNEHRRRRVSDHELDIELDRIITAERPLKKALEEAKAQARFPEAIAADRASRLDMATKFARIAADRDSIDRRALRTMMQSAVERIVYNSMDDIVVYLRFMTRED